MAYSLEDSKIFYNLFISNEAAYGMTVIGDIVNGKTEATCQLIHKPLELSVIGRHLSGDMSIGAAPLRAGNTLRWCAIDIDNYVGNINDIVEAIEHFDLPLLPCYSKSKKLHIYCFFSEDTLAEDAISLIRWYAAAFRCDSKVEIFPKQLKLTTNNRFYSWINLPYFDANSDNHRKCVRSDGTLLSLSEFVERAQQCQLSLEEHINKQKALPYYGAPPCIMTGVILRDVPPGTRNNWLYNVACYLRMDDENADIIEPLLALNDTLHSPLPEREIQTTVAKVAGRSYYYQCTGMLGCNKTLCKTTDKGIGNNSSTKFSFGSLTKVLTDPIQWEWEVNGKVLRFGDTTEIMRQDEFRRQCMEKLNDIPYKVKEEKWTAIIRRALENVTEQHVEVYGNFGKGSQFLDALVDYFSGSRRKALDETQVYRGRVYNDDKSKVYRFNSSNLTTFLTDNCGLKIRPEDIRIRLSELNAKQVDGAIWTLPYESLPVKPTVQVTQVDYHDDTVIEENPDVQF